MQCKRRKFKNIILLMSTFFFLANTDNFPLTEHVRIHIGRVDRELGCAVDAINRVSSRMNTVEPVRTWLRWVRSCDAQTDAILPLVPPLRECGASKPTFRSGARNGGWALHIPGIGSHNGRGFAPTILRQVLAFQKGRGGRLDMDRLLVGVL